MCVPCFVVAFLNVDPFFSVNTILLHLQLVWDHPLQILPYFPIANQNNNPFHVSPLFSVVFLNIDPFFSQTTFISTILPHLSLQRYC
jgi:hypothetical protein